MPRAPRVLLDTTSIPAERGGVGRYVDQLVAALDATGEVDLTIACQSRDADRLAELSPTARLVPQAPRLQSRPARLAWEQTGLPWLVRRTGVDVVHSPHYTLPLATRVPTVVTLHDATFFSDRELHTGLKGRFFRTWTKVSLHRAAVCVVPSRATATELERFTGHPADQIVIAPHGVDRDIFHPPTEAEITEFRTALGLGDSSWIAFLGTLEPRKNVPNLIRGWVSAFADRPDPPALILAGSKGWDEEVLPTLATVPPQLRALQTGHLPIEQLPALLGGAVLTCYPSLGEGFGLPVLEAMSCASPTLTTDRLSLPEVGGDAVAYCETDADSIAAALLALTDDEPRRAELREAGQRRAATFTWQSCAQGYLQAYHRALGGSA